MPSNGAPFLYLCIVNNKEQYNMKVLELFRKYDFKNVLPHLDHLFVVNSKHHLSEASIEVFRGIYNYWANEFEKKPTDCYVRLVSRWEYTSPSIDMNCHVRNKTTFCYSVADQKDMIEVLSMEVKVDEDVEISEVELAAGLFWEMTYREPENIANNASVSK